MNSDFKNKDKFLACITGLPGKSRDADLRIDLKLRGLEYLPDLGVIPKPEDDEVDDFSVAAFGVIRTPMQAGCARAHLNAYKNFLGSDFEFLFVFEDDARLTDEFSEIHVLELMRKRGKGKPLVALLGHKELIYKKTNMRPKFRRVIAPPSTSFGYAINRASACLALEFAEQNGVLGMSDWPPVLVARARFYQWEGAMAACSPGAISTITDLRKGPEVSTGTRLRSTIKFCQLFGTRSLLVLGKMTILRGPILLAREIKRNHLPRPRSKRTIYSSTR